MADEDFTLQGIRSFDELLAHSREGKWLLGMLRAAGLISHSSKPFAGEEPQAFPTSVNNLRGDELGNKQLYWQSQLGRVTEMLGLMDALMADEELLLKRARAKAKAKVLREIINQANTDVAEAEEPPVKAVVVKLTKDQLDALVEDDEDTQTGEDKVARLHRMSITLKAIKETYAGYCAVLSREVTRQGDLLKARI